MHALLVCPNSNSRPWITYVPCAPRFVKLALMVLHEKRMGASSLVAGYVAQLPESFQTPLHWTLDERSQLQYPHLESEVSDACLEGGGCGWEVGWRGR